jgi:hypothetical protein
MMRSKLAVLFVLPLLAFGVLDSFKIDVDDRVSVSFPQEPRQQTSGGNLMWSCGDTGTIYIAMAVDFQKLGFDSAAMATQFRLDDFYVGYRDGNLSKLPKGEVVDEIASTYKGHPVRDYVFKMTAGDQRMTYYSKNLFIGTKVYSLSFIELKGPQPAANRDAFFRSLQLK